MGTSFFMCFVIDEKFCCHNVDNVYNAFMKKDFQYPWASAAIQLAVGLFYVVPLFLLKLRKMPKISLEDFKRLLPIALLNAGGHACTVNAMFEKGGGSFTHVIKVKWRSYQPIQPHPSPSPSR